MPSAFAAPADADAADDTDAAEGELPENNAIGDPE
jgi:hypothetical protein